MLFSLSHLISQQNRPPKIVACKTLPCFADVLENDFDRDTTSHRMKLCLSELVCVVISSAGGSVEPNQEWRAQIELHVILNSRLPALLSTRLPTTPPPPASCDHIILT